MSQKFLDTSKMRPYNDPQVRLRQLVSKAETAHNRRVPDALLQVHLVLGFLFGKKTTQWRKQCTIAILKA